MAPAMANDAMPDMGVPGTHLYNRMVQACVDHANLAHVRPMSPTSTFLQVDWPVREQARAGVDYQKETVIEPCRKPVEQDARLCEYTPKGVLSRSYRPVPCSAYEDDTERLVQWYLNQLQSARVSCEIPGYRDRQLYPESRCLAGVNIGQNK